jgi:hypothetical protein
MEGRIRVDIMAEMIPTMANVNPEATTGTSALVQREVALTTRQLSSQLLTVRREQSVIVSSLEADVARLGSLSGLYGGQNWCSSLNSDLPADWDLVFDFMGRHTSPGSGRVGDNIEDCVARADTGPSLYVGPWPQHGTLDQVHTHLASAQVLNLQKDISDLRDRILSKYVSIDSFIFPSLSETVVWCIQHMPGDFNFIGRSLFALWHWEGVIL